ncbi:hypothetical protein [Haladaptatus sp. DYSN1]|uniref:hypothetical protein n=1 Tax=unclassified Haladaptatus TaxID=2622732 RepID=UPI0024055271|nr:hypothetical protein [Haladaptatus sp. DYSN1]
MGVFERVSLRRFEVNERRLVFALALLATLATGAGAASAYIIGSQFLFYPLVMVFFGAATYTAYALSTETDVSLLLSAIAQHRLMDATLLFAIAATGYLARLDPIGLPLVYYGSVAVLVGLLAFRIIYNPTRLALVYIVVVAILIRATIWHSAPVVGRDARMHMALGAYIASTGQVAPELVSYYHWYPVTHVLSGAVILFTGLTAKVSLFVAAAIQPVIAIGVVYCLIELLFPDADPVSRRRAALLGATLIVVSPWHVARTSVPIAQSLNLVFVTLVLYFALRSHQRIYLRLLIPIVALITFTHNLTPFILTFFLGMFVFVQLAGRLIGLPRVIYYSRLVVFGVLILTVQYWIYISFFQLQVWRVLRLLRPSESLSARVDSSEITAKFAFSLADPLVQVGLELLVYISLFIIAAFLVLRQLLRREATPATTWVVTVAFIFGMMTALHFVGEGTQIDRSFQNLSVLVAPVFAFVSLRLVRTRPGKVFLVLVLVVFPASTLFAATAGVSNPMMSTTERTVGERTYLTDSEIAGAEHAIAYVEDPVFTDIYLAATMDRRHVEKGAVNPEVMRYFLVPEIDEEVLEQYGILGPYEDHALPVLYRSLTTPLSETTIGRQCDVVYASRTTNVIFC